MNKLLVIGAMVVAAAAGACTSAKDIAPAPVAEDGYQSWSCQLLSEEALRLSSEIDKNSRLHDTMGRRFGAALALDLLLGPSPQDKELMAVPGDIPKLKGEQEAVRNVMTTKKCSPPAPPSAPKSGSAETPAEKK